MIATFVEDTGTVLNALSTIEHLLDILVRLQLLEFFIWVKVGILVIETDDVAQVNKVRGHMVHERASIDI